MLNLGILAHVDAGKTSLTERLLHAAGVIDAVGSVDRGDTQTDTLALERRRGITIRSAVVSFTVGDVAVNLIDTPGHPDFIAEVERALGVLDGAVLVVSAVEGVQAQTRILMRALQRLRVPTLIFVNKIDRAGAGGERVLAEVAAKVSPTIVALGAPEWLGTRAAAFVPYDRDDAALTIRLTELLAEHDDALLAAWLGEAPPPSSADLWRTLAEQTRRARVHPVLFGAARTGAGVDALRAAIAELLPAQRPASDGPAAGTVFKIERGPAGEKLAYVRMRSGAIRMRERVRVDGGEEKVTAIEVFDRGGAVARPLVAAGEIARLRGLSTVRIGDAIGTAATAPPADEPQFAPPTLEAVVVPRRPEDRRALRVALGRLAEQDPLIRLRRLEDELAVSLYGEVQKEVVEATLAEDFGVEVVFAPSTTICIERPAGSGLAAEIIGTDANPFLATVGLRVEPAARDEVTFGLEVELGSMPLSFFTAVEETVRETLEQGLYGWRVTGCTVTMTHSGYWAKQSHSHASFDKSMSSTARDFRQLTPLVLMRALAQAGTVVHEPAHRFRIDAPADALSALLSLLARLDAVPDPPAMDGEECRIAGEIAAARVDELRRRLPTLTRGEGLLESAFHRWRTVRGAPPRRARTGPDPLDRIEYVRAVTGRP
jgi:ribosomal protection tetracycline resistance protein